jgi:holo-[acyl-carrier protein] synthase
VTAPAARRAGRPCGCVVRVGVDLAEVERVGRLLADHPEGVRELFTEREIEYCGRKKDRDVHFAGRFAAKEAVLKAFGTGLGRRMRWTDVEVVNLPLGKPEVRLNGEVAVRARRLGLRDLDLSLTHTRSLAMANVVAVWNAEDEPCDSI